MKRCSLFRRAAWAVLALLVLAAPAVSAATVMAVLGEDVPLSGISTGGGNVYLFLTGPNLADGGVNLGTLSPVVTGTASSFTVASTDDNGRWNYTWKTAGLSLDPGVYTLYASDTPAGRNDLSSSNAVYGTTGISLSSPGLTLDTSGTLVVQSSVEGAEIFMNGEYVGTAPGSIGGLVPGEYTVKINATGYMPWTGTVTIEQNKTTDLMVSLSPLTTTTVETTEPTTAPTTTTTPTAAPLLPAALGALALLALVLRKR